MNKMRMVQVEAEQEATRQSRDIVSPSKLSFSDTLIIDTVADALFKEIQNAQQQQQPFSDSIKSVDQSLELKKIGEEVLIEKLKGILDEVAETQIKKPSQPVKVLEQSL